MSVGRFATASLCAFFLLSTSVCFAAPPQREPCDLDGAGLVAALEKAGMAVVADGVTDTGHFLQVMVDQDSGAFSIVVRLADGPGCVFHAGVGWAWTPDGGDRP